MWSALNKVSELLVNPDRRVIRIIESLFGLCALCRANYCYPTAVVDSSLPAPYNWSVSYWSPRRWPGRPNCILGITYRT